MRSRRSAQAGLLAAAFAVLAVTLAIYGLRELVPVLSTGVVYLLAVLLVSTYWGRWLGLMTACLERGGVQLLPPPADAALHDRRRRELGRSGGFSGRSPVVTSGWPIAARCGREEAERGRRGGGSSTLRWRASCSAARASKTHCPPSGRASPPSSTSPSVSPLELSLDRTADQRRIALPLVVEGRTGCAQ